MFNTEIGLTQYEEHDKFNPLEQYNRDMQIITNTCTVASGEIIKVNTKIATEIERVELRIDANDERLDDHDSEMDAIETKNAQQDNELGVLRAGVHSLSTTTASISSALIKHIETATTENATLTAEIKKVETNLSTRISADAERIAVNETAIAQHSDKIRALETSNTGNASNITALTGRVSNLENVDRETGVTLQQLRDKNTEQDTKIQINTNNISAFGSRMETAEQNIEDLDARIIHVALETTEAEITLRTDYPGITLETSYGIIPFIEFLNVPISKTLAYATLGQVNLQGTLLSNNSGSTEAPYFIINCGMRGKYTGNGTTMANGIALMKHTDGTQVVYRVSNFNANSGEILFAPNAPFIKPGSWSIDLYLYKAIACGSFRLKGVLF